MAPVNKLLRWGATNVPGHLRVAADIYFLSVGHEMIHQAEHTRGAAPWTRNAQQVRRQRLPRLRWHDDEGAVEASAIGALAIYGGRRGEAGEAGEAATRRARAAATQLLPWRERGPPRLTGPRVGSLLARHLGKRRQILVE